MQYYTNQKRRDNPKGGAPPQNGLRYHKPSNGVANQQTAHFGYTTDPRMQLNGKVPQTPTAPKNKPYIQNKHGHRGQRGNHPPRNLPPPMTPPRQPNSPLDQRFQRMRDYSPTPLRSRKNLVANPLTESIANIFNKLAVDNKNQDHRHKGPKGTYVFKASRLGLFKPSDSRTKRKVRSILKARGDYSRGKRKKVKFNSEVFVYDIESYKEYNASVVRELKRLKMQETQHEKNPARGGPPPNIKNSIAFNKNNMQKRKQAEEIKAAHNGPMGRSSHRATPNGAGPRGARYSNRNANGGPQGAMTFQGRRDPNVRGSPNGGSSKHGDRNDFLFDSLPMDDPKFRDGKRKY